MFGVEGGQGGQGWRSGWRVGLRGFGALQTEASSDTSIILKITRGRLSRQDPALWGNSCELLTYSRDPICRTEVLSTTTFHGLQVRK